MSPFLESCCSNKILCSRVFKKWKLRTDGREEKDKCQGSNMALIFLYCIAFVPRSCSPFSHIFRKGQMATLEGPPIRRPLRVARGPLNWSLSFVRVFHTILYTPHSLPNQLVYELRTTKLQIIPGPQSVSPCHPSWASQPSPLLGYMIHF